MNRMSVERRRFLRSVTGAAMARLARGTGRAETGVGAHLSVAYEDAGRQIASDFVGLSYESAILAAGNYFAPDNGSVLGLIRSLGANGVPKASPSPTPSSFCSICSRGGSIDDRAIHPLDAVIPRLAVRDLPALDVRSCTSLI
jgi:hypothetical protein